MLDKREIISKLQAYECALQEVLHAKNLTDAKEVAADILDLELDEYLIDELELDGDSDDLDFGDATQVEW